MSEMSQRRWPCGIFAEGEEPDYRFSLANERTFLAWVRTSLALLVGGVALGALELSIPRMVQVGIALELILLGWVCAALSWVRWTSAERAMRRSQPLPDARVPLVLVVGVLLASTALLVVGYHLT